MIKVKIEVKGNKINCEELNLIVDLADKFYETTNNKISLIHDGTFLILNGKLSELTESAKHYYDYLNENGVMRNLRILK